MYSFFNGIADNVFFLGVACECIKIELTQMGFSQIDFYPVDIDVSDAEIWKDTSFRYFNSNQYTCQCALWVMERHNIDAKNEVNQEE